MQTLVTSWLTSSVSAPVSRAAVAYGQLIARPLPVVDQRAQQIAIISHELRNSLAVVRNAAGMLRRKVDAENVERARLLIERHVCQMNRHIEDLLNAEPLSGQKDALRLSCVDLRTILSNAVDANAADFAHRSHHL